MAGRWAGEPPPAARPRRRLRLGGGGALILLGGVFLLQNLGLAVLPANWWALFILIPVVTTAATAWSLYRAAGGHWTPAARGAAAGSAILAFVSAMFLFALDWGLLWPVFLILAGLAALANWGGSRHDRGW